MSNQYVFNDRLPLAPLKIAALESCRDLAQKVNDHIVNFRRNDAEELLRRQGNLQYRGYDVDSYLLDCACPRFGSGEAKGIVNESPRNRYFLHGRCNKPFSYLQDVRICKPHVPG